MHNDQNVLILPELESFEEVISGFSPNVNFTNGSYRNIQISIIDDSIQITHKGIDLKDYSFVWLSSSWTTRDLAYAIHLYLEDLQIDHTYVEPSTSKITDHVSFILNDIISPNSIYMSRDIILKSRDIIEKSCDYPFIVKDLKGSRGKYSLLINDWNELVKKVGSLPKNRKFLIQSYIPNEYDWGVLISNGKIVSAEKSYATNGNYLNNACNGAKEVFVDKYEIPKEISEIALNASNALGLSWSRTDIIIDSSTGKPYLLEVNRYPGITSGSSEVIGAKMFLISLLNKRKVVNDIDSFRNQGVVTANSNISDKVYINRVMEGSES